MTTISTRIEDDLRADLEEAAAGEGVSVSEYIRQAIEIRLGRENDMEWRAPASLPRRDRLILSMLHELAGRLSDDDDETERHDRMTTVLHDGYAGEYGDVFAALHDELSRSHCSEVWDILDMFRVMKASIEKVGIDEVKALDENAERALVFRGFDLNDPLEGKMLSYVRYLLSTDRWTELADDIENGSDHGNSHSPVLASYRRMLAVYKPIWSELVRGDARGRRGYHLTADELAAVAKAWPYPR